MKRYQWVTTWFVTAASAVAFLMGLSSASAAPIPQHKIENPGVGSWYDGLGHSIAIQGDTLIAGAPWTDMVPSPNVASGVVCVYERGKEDKWDLQQELSGDLSVADDFGRSLSISGDTLLIGAPEEEELDDDTGAAYVFVRDHSGRWIRQTKLTPSDRANFIYFGNSVSISGDTALIGARSPYPEEEPPSGSVYIFTRDENGAWTERTKLVPENILDGETFGHSVALEDDTAVFSSTRYDYGSVYVFERSSSGVWDQTARLRHEDFQFGGKFGETIALSGTTVLVSEHGRAGDRGAIFAFTRDQAGNWSHQMLTASDSVEDDQFGKSLSISGDKALIGAPGRKVTEESSGAAAKREEPCPKQRHQRSVPTKPRAKGGGFCSRSGHGGELKLAAHGELICKSNNQLLIPNVSDPAGGEGSRWA